MAYEVLMPQLGLTMEEGTVSQWIKHEGDEVKVGDVIVEITTDKLTNEVTSEHDGVLLKIVAQEGADIPVKGLLAYIGQPGEAVGGASAPAAAPAAEAAAAPAAPAAAAPAPAAKNGARIRISPLARKTAAKLGVDYSGIAGSGPAGRIVQKDILAAAEAMKSAPAAAPAPAAPAAPAAAAPAAAPASSVELMDGDTVVKLTGMRKVIAQRMLQSHTEIPPVTQTIKVDVTELMAFRKVLLAKTGKKYSVNDLILKATAKCLRQHPEMLVSFDAANKQVIQRAHVNLGMAVALDTGLITPVIRDADKMGLEQLADTAKDLAARAKDNKLTSDEYKGSTFTISNLGMFGIESFTPIINQPDAAILGVCAIQDELALDDEGKVIKKQVMRLSLTLDHRALDGAVVAKFEMALRDLLQSPMSIVL